MKNTHEIRVLVHGKPVRTYSHEGRTFIEGRPGSEYTIEIKNPSYENVLAVVSVDGVNVVTGLPATVDDTAGYVISPRSSYRIKGFRKDLDTVGSFRFCDATDAYCNEHDLEGNHGVIGVRVYSEALASYTYTYTCPEPEHEPDVPYVDIPWKRGPWPWDKTPWNPNELVWCGTTNGTQLYHSNVQNDMMDIGTTWGSAQSDSVTDVGFDVGTLLYEHEILYATKDGLRQMGVNVDFKGGVSFPKAFNGFAKPPKGWKG